MTLSLWTVVVKSIPATAATICVPLQLKASLEQLTSPMFSLVFACLRQVQQVEVLVSCGVRKGNDQKEEEEEDLDFVGEVNKEDIMNSASVVGRTSLQASLTVVMVQWQTSIAAMTSVLQHPWNTQSLSKVVVREIHRESVTILEQFRLSLLFLTFICVDGFEVTSITDVVDNRNADIFLEYGGSGSGGGCGSEEAAIPAAILDVFTLVPSCVSTMQQMLSEVCRCLCLQCHLLLRTYINIFT